MKKSQLTYFIVAVFAAFLLTAMVSAQSTDINRVEAFAGYSNASIASPYPQEDLQFIDSVVGGSNLSTNLGKRYNMHGFNFKLTGNFSKYVGAQFDFSRHSNKRSFTAGASNLTHDYSYSNYLGGIQIKNNASDGPVVKPFANALVGVARQNVTISGLTGPLNTEFGGNSVTEKQTNLALAIGGGLDVRVHPRVDIRVFQVDYNPTFIKETEDFDGKFQSNFRFSFGIVFH